MVGAINEIEKLKNHFSSFSKIQLVYNLETENWEFNYIATETGGRYRYRKILQQIRKKIERALPGK
ncbi:MAG: hypothetical protein K2M15_05155 [Oscillospiraceae bacterium]|nr:hypothetical protein [Oscillospiraceae bacterium]